MENKTDTARLVEEVLALDLFETWDYNDKIECKNLAKIVGVMLEAIQVVSDRDWYFAEANDWNTARDILLAARDKAEELARDGK